MNFSVNTPNINVNTPNINVNTPNINTQTNYEVTNRNSFERDNNFTINANYGEGRNINTQNNNIMFSQANTLGSRQ